jgi:hypothetical protein
VIYLTAQRENMENNLEKNGKFVFMFENGGFDEFFSFEDLNTPLILLTGSLN